MQDKDRVPGYRNTEFRCILRVGRPEVKDFFSRIDTPFPGPVQLLHDVQEIEFLTLSNSIPVIRGLQFKTPFLRINLIKKLVLT